MLKRLSMLFAACALALAAAGCSTTPEAAASPVQQATNTTAETCKGVVASIKTANAAVLSGALKGDNARAALKGLTAAQDGCNLALASIQAALAAANSAASGVPK